jgi:hypothetical protein
MEEGEGLNYKRMILAQEARLGSYILRKAIYLHTK